MLVAGFVLAATFAGPASAQDTKSKLGVFLIENFTDGAQQVLKAQPRILKVLDPQDIVPVNGALIEYLEKNPKGIAVIRIWRGTQGLRYQLREDPVESADDYWDLVMVQVAEELEPAEGQVVYLEGPNQDENTPTFESVAAAAWFGKFSARLAELIAELGFRPCIGSIKPGDPKGSKKEFEAKIEAFLPAIRAAVKYKGAISYHAFSLKYTTDPKIEIESSLRYRLIHDYLERKHPALAKDVKFILSECGVGQEVGADVEGWRDGGDAAKYQKWLTWFDNEIRKDDYVLGAALFEMGDAKNWHAFDLEPLANWLANHIKSAK